jgi:hypothetical protein
LTEGAEEADALDLAVEDAGVDCLDWAADSWGESSELISIFCAHCGTKWLDRENDEMEELFSGG